MTKVSFGSEILEFELEPGDSLTEKELNDRFDEWDTDRFRRGLNDYQFTEFLSRGRLLVVINDAFRPTPTGEVLSQIKSWYPDLQADFIVACGNHPPPEESEIATMFKGFSISDDSKLFVHDSRNIDDMTRVGEFEGIPLYLNKKIFEYPAIMVIGSVEPHYFAGYTGGRKSLVPGLSDIESNRRNHVLAVSAEAKPLRLKGNPVAEDLDQLLELINISSLFSIQIVAGKDQKIIDCFCGDLRRSFEEAVAMAEQIYSFSLDKQYDLVIAEMKPPLDRNLYQIQKAIENNASAVRDGGTIVAVSECGEGIGNDEFYQLAGKLKNEEMALSYAEMENPPLGIHKLSRILKMAKRINIRALTGLKHEILHQVFLEPAVSIEAEIQKLKQGERYQVDILLVRDAGLLVAMTN
jgi:nickel-dependent lactate racemase